ncbi:MAG TPA: metal-dependent hydrolase [Actinomycetota bacterium]|nr:metal-dependent hydrolase [Actinomycetota bacterium]
MLGRHHAAVGAGLGLAVTHVDHAPALFARALESVHPLGITLSPGIAGPTGAALAFGLGGSICGLFALLPDLDSPSSTLGSLLPAWWHHLTPGHRGPTHWVASGFLVAAAVYLLAFVSAGGPPVMFLPHLALAGYMGGHLAMDEITHDGCPLLGPFVRRSLKLPISFRTGGPVEPVVAGALVIGLIWWGLDLSALVDSFRAGGIA